VLTPQRTRSYFRGYRANHFTNGRPKTQIILIGCTTVLWPIVTDG